MYSALEKLECIIKRAASKTLFNQGNLAAFDKIFMIITHSHTYPLHLPVRLSDEFSAFSKQRAVLPVVMPIFTFNKYQNLDRKTCQILHKVETDQAISTLGCKGSRNLRYIQLRLDSDVLEISVS
jgi:hypothetical protein